MKRNQRSACAGITDRLGPDYAIELERDVKRTQNDVHDFKSEIRQMVSVISTNINAISNLTSTMNVNIDLQELLKQAKEQLQEADIEPDPLDLEEIKEELLLEDEDTIMALARTRIRLEYLLRRILNKRLYNEGTKEIKYMSAGRLYKLFLKEYPRFNYLDFSFEYVLKICNVAIHGQQVPFGQAQEALDMGARLISTLNNIVGQGDYQNDQENSLNDQPR